MTTKPNNSAIFAKQFSGVIVTTYNAGTDRWNLGYRTPHAVVWEICYRGLNC